MGCEGDESIFIQNMRPLLFGITEDDIGSVGIEGFGYPIFGNNLASRSAAVFRRLVRGY